MKIDKEEEFLNIMNHHEGQIRRICLGFRNSNGDVEDLYQEVLINIWKGLENFRNEAATSTWIHRITINTCILWNKRKKKFRVNLSNVEIRSSAISMDQDPDGNIELIKLRKAISTLKPGDKSLILLVLEELSYKEIAKVTGLSISNIGVKISRIKSRIKKQMQNY